MMGTVTKQIIDDMINTGLIRDLGSPWASPVVMIIKDRKKPIHKDNIRFCVDYRKINVLTMTDNYPIPDIQQLLETFAGKKYFSKLDLTSGYWQVLLMEREKPRTAFITKWGLYEFNRLPFGLRNAPAAFQRLMRKILRKQIKKGICEVYLDDIIIASNTMAEHKAHVLEVLQVLRSRGWTVKSSKCVFFQLEIKYLGHIISEEGLRIDPDKVEAIVKLNRPKDRKTVQRFLGSVQFLSKWIKNLQKRTAHISDLLKKDVSFDWTDKQQKAWLSLKKALITVPILKFPKVGIEFMIETDASM